MLDDYKTEQRIAYQTIINSIKSNKISHAYIIESNGYSKAYNFALAIAKYIFCPNFYSNNDKCNKCFQCQNIDNNDFLELKIIDPSGMWIKKSELQELQDIFSKKSVVGNRKVYIINNAEKLNESSSNSILKFLEEPEEGITAILIVNNIYQLLSTIVSRCQILSLIPHNNIKNKPTVEKIAHFLNNNEDEINEFISDGDNLFKINCVINFVKYYEDNHYNTLININKMWHQYFKERIEISNAFSIMLLFYKDVLNCLIGKEISVFNDYEDIIIQIKEKNTKNQIIYKINVIMNLSEKIKFNINNNLLIDKLIIELEGSEENG